MQPSKSTRETKHSSRYEKELRRLHRHQPRKSLIAIIVLGVLGLVVAIEIGRALAAMRRVESFVTHLQKRPTAANRAELDRFALTLSDHNPFVRSAAIGVLRVATSWNLGSDPAAWRERWHQEREQWEYRSPETPPPPLSVPTTNPELRALLDKLTNEAARPPEP